MKETFLQLLQEEGKKQYFQIILEKLKDAEKYGNILPKSYDIFNAFNDFQTYETKVIFLGQDPYPTNNVADGYAFSTQSEKTPKSLVNIFKELKKDYPETIIQTNNLRAWSKQGVLLLNVILTVFENEPLSHASFGWQTFTKKIVEHILSVNPETIIIALGNPSQKFVSKLSIPPKNYIALSHPSPLGYRHSFKDGQLFKKINQMLIEENKIPIKWDLVKE